MAEEKKMEPIKDISAGYEGKRMELTEGYQGKGRLERGYQPKANIPADLQPPNVGSTAVIPSANQSPASVPTKAEPGKQESS